MKALFELKEQLNPWISDRAENYSALSALPDDPTIGRFVRSPQPKRRGSRNLMLLTLIQMPAILDLTLSYSEHLSAA